jgi:hypothetical protein
MTWGVMFGTPDSDTIPVWDQLQFELNSQPDLDGGADHNAIGLTVSVTFAGPSDKA